VTADSRLSGYLSPEILYGVLDSCRIFGMSKKRAHVVATIVSLSMDSPVRSVVDVPDESGVRCVSQCSKVYSNRAGWQAEQASNSESSLSSS